jgi:tetratricopeptide (TPR) repeat protein
MTEQLQRPRTDAFQDPRVAQPPLEEVEELSYSNFEEEVEEVDEAELLGGSYEPPAYGQQGGDPYPSQEGAVYGRDAAGYDNAGHQPGYGQEAQPGQYDAAYQGGYAQNEGYGGHPNAQGYGASLEEAAPLSDADSAEHVQKTLADANAFRRVRLYAKALETLRTGLELEPRSMDLHEVYRDVLIESGQTDEAVQEMLVIASLYVDALDGESAARALQDVLAFDPQNARGIEMLQELGYEIVDENEDLGGGQVELDGNADIPAYADDGLGDDRLPSYDLEEIGPADVSPRYADERQVHVGRGPSQIPAYGDDELGGEALPSFPLDEPDAPIEVYADADDDVVPARSNHLSGGLGARSQPPAAMESDDLASPPAFGGRPPSQVPARVSHRPPSIAAAASRELEDALEEAEFFCSRGLYDDAKAILAEQLGKHPNNPLLRERIAEVDSQEVQRGSGARERPREQSAFDIGASLDALESLDYDKMQPAEGHADEDQQIDVEEVFAKFKEGVAKQISVEDSDSHYNLGIAYKEMLLLDDAIREFNVAAMDLKRECVCRSMVGMIQLERGHINEAIEAFLQGLNSAIKDPSQETVLCYEIGAAYEAKKMNKDALTYYQKAMRRDPNYRDVQERVRRLAKAEPKHNLRQAAVGADDEFDRAFDDLLSKA